MGTFSDSVFTFCFSGDVSALCFLLRRDSKNPSSSTSPISTSWPKSRLQLIMQSAGLFGCRFGKKQIENSMHLCARSLAAGELRRILLKCLKAQRATQRDHRLFVSDPRVAGSASDGLAADCARLAAVFGLASYTSSIVI